MRRIVFALSLLVILVVCLIACGQDSYKVTYTYQDGNEAKAQSVILYKQQNNIIQPLTLEGYSFKGYFAEDGIMYFDENGYQLNGVIIDKDISLVAKLEKESYYITYHAQSGMLEGDKSESQITYKYGDIISSLPTVESNDSNYEFDGWFNKDETIRYSNGAIPVEEKMIQQYMPKTGLTHYGDLYARFKPKDVTVTINYSDGYTPNTEIKLKTGSVLDLSQYYKSENGREIVGFTTMAGFEAQPPKYVSGDITIYAIWKSYKMVTFVYSEGDTVDIKLYEEVGKSTQLLKEARPGYRLDGWHTSSSLSGNPIMTVPYGALSEKYYAKLSKESYTIKFVTGTSQQIEDMTYFSGEVTALPELSRDGYCFVGWAESERDPFCDKVLDKNASGNKTLYAQWIDVDNAVSVQLSLIESESILEYAYNRGEGLILPELDLNETDPETGIVRIFTGWYDKKTGKKIENGYILTENIVLEKRYYESIPISTVEDFKNIKNDLEKSYHLTCDIDFQNEVIYPLDTFRGIFDGNGYTLSGFILKGKNRNVYGVFSQITGTIKNLTLENATCKLENDFYNYTLAGALCGNNQGLIENCHIKNVKIEFSVIDAICLGGLVGRSEGDIVSCSVEADISGTSLLTGYRANGGNGQLYVPSYGINDSNIGGLVGFGAKVIKDSYANCNININLKASETTAHKANVGGFIGYSGPNSQLECQGCYALGRINVTRLEENQDKIYYTVGGFVGTLVDGKISKCYADSVYLDGINAKYLLGNDVFNYAGGAFAGVINIGGTIENCYTRVSAELKYGTSAFTGIVCGSIYNSYSYSDTQANNYSIMSGMANTLSGDGKLTNCFTTFYSLANEENGFVANCFKCVEPNEEENETEIKKEKMKLSSFVYDRVLFSRDIWLCNDMSFPTLK